MHIDDITAALASRDMASIKEAFLALANYPKEDRIDGLTGGNAMIYLEAAAEALHSDIAPCLSTVAKRSGLLRELVCGRRGGSAYETGLMGRAFRNDLPGELAHA